MTISIKEKITFIKEDVAFHQYCKKAFSGIFNSDRELSHLDYAKFYLYIHLYLEIGIARIFRQIKYAYVYLKTDFRDMTIEELDQKQIPDKFQTLKDFVSAKDIKKISWHFNDFAKKRNAIAHGHSISEVIFKKKAIQSKTKSWCTKKEIEEHVDLYNKIVLAIRDIIDQLPALKAKGKEDLKNILTTI